MVEVKDKDRPILNGPGSGAYQKALDDIVPREFHNMTILFNQDLLEAWYPTIDQIGGQSLHMNQPLQLFSIMNPDFAFVWQFELDVRFTGNWYNFLENAESWACEQPYVHFGDDPSSLVLNLSLKTCFGRKLTFLLARRVSQFKCLPWKSNADSEICVDASFSGNELPNSSFLLTTVATPTSRTA